MIERLPASLKLTVPLILLVFAATLSAVNLLYHVPQAERAAEEDGRKRLAQEMSRLQSTLEYSLLKGDEAAAQHEIAVLAHNHDVVFAVLADDRNDIVASTRRAWLGQQVAAVLPQVDPDLIATDIRERRAGISIDADGNELLGHASILLGGDRSQLAPSRIGGAFMGYDLARYKAEARQQVQQQSIYWAGWVVALALAMWLVFHFLLTRRTARLVDAAEQLASGNFAARSGLSGFDELARLGRAFDAMALDVEKTETRLRRDIAERERAEEALRVSEASYREIFDAAEDAIFVNDLHTGQIVDVNRKACASFGYTREEFLRLEPGALGTGERPYNPEGARELIARAAAGEQVRFEWHGRRHDASDCWHEVFIKPVTIGGKERVLALARDITEKKRAAEELARQRESLYQREKLAALGSLLAGVAHELNNPLSVVVARSVMLEERGDPATQSAAQKIRTAAERGARIVRTFLAMARQQPPVRGPVSINEVVTAALDITGYAVRTSSIDVVLELGKAIPPILADADQLHQVMLNLIINAQQSMQDQPAPRTLRVSSRHDVKANVIRVVVADNGPGIPEHLRARVFEPFFTTKPIGVGTGVGLAVSLGIIEAHGGTLTVDCPPKGGAAFEIVLPAIPVESAEDDDVVAAKRLPERKKVLVVDDERDIRGMLVEILGGANHRVVACASGREALERLASESFDLILTDIRMPDIDGRALYPEIERRWPEQASRVVFVTGDTLAPGLRDFVMSSGRPVLDKPFMPAEVRRIVAELTAESVRASSD